jgi:hypothetical protein
LRAVHGTGLENRSGGAVSLIAAVVASNAQAEAQFPIICHPPSTGTGRSGATVKKNPRIVLVRLLCSVSLLYAATAAAQSIDRPEVRAGDTWVYRTTEEKGASGWNQTRDELTVTRVTGSAIYFNVRPSGSTQAPKEVFLGKDWSRMRDVNGKETLVAQPMQFPLSPGKSWTVRFTEENPNKGFRTETWDDKYSVVGYEDIEVPGGKYRALKIEAEGRWSGTLAPAETVVQGADARESGTTMATQVQKTTAREVSGRLYKAFWYVPEVKRWVKSVEEDYSNGGVRNARRTMELESYKPAT